MAYSLNFYGTEKTNTNKTVLEAFHNAENEITISIKEEDVEHATVISFDRETARSRCRRVSPTRTFIASKSPVSTPI